MKNCKCKVKYSHGGLINPYRFNNGGITFGGSSLKYDPLNKNILTSANVNLRSGNLDIGGEYSGLHSTDKSPSKYFMGGTGSLNFGTYAGTHKGDYENRFMGRLSGKLGFGRTGRAGSGGSALLGVSNVTNKGLAASGRLDLMSGRPGKTSCIGGMCYAPPVTGRGFGIFGEYGNKYSQSPGLKVGAGGYYGNVNVEGGYNLTTKSPFIGLGAQIPLR